MREKELSVQKLQAEVDDLQKSKSKWLLSEVCTEDDSTLQATNASLEAEKSSVQTPQQELEQGIKAYDEDATALAAELKNHCISNLSTAL
jgi:hypothetical protein